jgi:hypothetical protein
MPRLSLYKPEKGNDYKFIDKQTSEMFTVGGTDVYWHKYLGANTTADNATADQPNYPSNQVTNIQDLLFLENRDRTYDTEIYRGRGIYNVQNIDFNLSQFGLFIDNDTLYMTVHINDINKILGRKPISGDVIELPHLRDDFALNSFNVALPRYYQVTDVGRASEGFSATWYPHLYRLKLKRVMNQQQFASIFSQPAKDSNGDPIVGANTTLADLLATYNSSLNINNQVIAQAESDAPKSGYETRQFYTLAVDPATGKPFLDRTADTQQTHADSDTGTTDEALATPLRTGYTGYLVGDGVPTNGAAFGFGIQFPDAPQPDDFFLRTDFLPNRLFRFDSTAWVKVEDAVRMDMTQTNTRNTLKTGFINNTNYTYNEEKATDVVTLTKGATVIFTRILYSVGHTVPYAVVKQGITTLGYALSDYPTTLYSTYNYTSPVGSITPCLKITLPVIDGTQQTIPANGQWSITLYNTREAERSSLSTALKYKPSADL